jgi:hypothetical protein
MRRVIKSAGILLVLGLLAFANTLHEQVLHSQVRVRTDTAGGSGTVIRQEGGRLLVLLYRVVSPRHRERPSTGH